MSGRHAVCRTARESRQTAHRAAPVRSVLQPPACHSARVCHSQTAPTCARLLEPAGPRSIGDDVGRQPVRVGAPPPTPGRGARQVSDSEAGAHACREPACGGRGDAGLAGRAVKALLGGPRWDRHGACCTRPQPQHSCPLLPSQGEGSGWGSMAAAVRSPAHPPTCIQVHDLDVQGPPRPAPGRLGSRALHQQRAAVLPPGMGRQPVVAPPRICRGKRT